MDAHFDTNLWVFVAYIGIVYLIGYFASRKTKNVSDYVLGGRNLNGPIAALAAGASDMSGWLLMALPGAFMVFGLGQIWTVISLILGAYINWALVAKRLRVYTEVANDSITIPAYLDNRFHDRSHALRVITAMVIVTFFTIYCAAGFVSGAYLMQLMFKLSYHQAVWYTVVIMVVYTCIGGFLAVSWVDFFQGSLMFVALIVVPIATYLHINDFASISHHLIAKDPDYFSFTGHATVVCVSAMLAWGLGYCGQPHILVRFMAAKSAKVIPMAKWICMIWMTIAMIGAIYTGILGAAYFSNGLNRPATVFLKLAEGLFNPVIAGVLLSAVISAVMSTIAAQLLASGSALSEDFYHALFRRKACNRELMHVSRISVVLIALLAAWFALEPNNTIFRLVSFAWSGMGASFGPVILLSLYWPRMTKAGAMAGLICGALMVILWHILSVEYGDIFVSCQETPGFEMIPGYVVSTLAIILVSLLDKSPSNVMIAEFEEVSKLVKEA